MLPAASPAYPARTPDPGRRRAFEILVVAASLPFPPDDGGRIVVFEPLRRLAARGHVVDLVTFGDPDSSTLAQLRRLCRNVVTVAPASTVGELVQRVVSPFRRRPHLSSRCWSPDLAREMHGLLGRHTYDVVQIEALSMGDYQAVAVAHGVPVVLRAQNVESALCAHQAGRAGGVRRWHYASQTPKVAAYEAARCAEADLCLALTASDARELADLAGRTVAVVPAGVDLVEFVPPASEPAEPRVLFTGTLNYRPNVDALHWFLDAVWPIVLSSVPAATFVVAGKNPTPSLRRRAGMRGVVLTGPVDDVRPLMGSAAVCVAPLRIGGGMRIKILQAMAMGRPIVSTSCGAEGIELEDARSAFLADTASPFAARIVELLGDAARRRAMGRAARELAEARYGWDPIVDRIEAHYRRLAAARGAHAEELTA